MSNSFDGFGDVLEGTAGIFSGSDGLASYDSLQHQYDKNGMVVQLHCEHCGKPRHMTVEWPELIAIKHNVAPGEAYGQNPQMRAYGASQWMNTSASMHRGVPYAWYPQLRCRCGNPFTRPLIRPGECEGHLAVARSNGWLTQNADNAFSQQAYMVAKHLGRIS